MPGNRIAYIGPDGNVYTIRPDGAGSRRLTDNDVRVGSAGGVLAQGQAQTRVIYAWPTWSPDGTTLAASRIAVEPNAISASVITIDAESGNSRKIYDNVPNAGFVASGAPHYFYWSPDGNHLSFLASTVNALEVLVTEVEEGGDPVGLIDGAPLYYTWAPDSRSLLIHRGVELFVSRAGADGFGRPERLGAVGGAFFAPAISRDGRTLAFAVQGGEEGALFTVDASTPSGAAEGMPVPGARRVLPVEPFTAFKWSPTRDEVAVADRFDGRRALFDRLSIANQDGSGHRVLVDESLMAFFWSPNGDRIAYVTWNQESRTFSWKYVDRDGGEPVKLIEFLPSEDFETLISFFDQYGYSSSIWSPDSSQIVFSGTLGPASAGRNGTSPDTDKVYVINVEAGASPLEIATGRYAVWSWN
ncbi:MAG: PD40 domain-containing protein [Dehalococcoidia bacterium]|nr:PD40 domain-containing protein [Dehalococcoidia bacterium]